MQLHIGHAVAIRKLRQFQDLGHHVIFVIGDGTGQAGDPSGKTKSREKFMTREQLRANARDYVAQAGKIVRFDGENPVEILYNGDWLNSLSLPQILDVAGHFTLQQMLERDLYQERMKAGVDLSLREFLYPLLQGYDSVAMNVDLELGGTDQTFNMLAGRKLVRAMSGKEKFVMTVPLLTDAKGVKIGKSEGNVIGITDAPNELYGKIMALGDDAIIPCFTLLTDRPADDIESMQKNMNAGENPMTFKKQLAFELTRQFHDEKAADEAQHAFEKTFQKREVGAGVTREFQAGEKDWNMVDLLVAAGAAKSKSEARRLVAQGAVETEGDIIKVGKKTFIKIKK
jgi:tyrosyl-tRNA synthetase